MPLALIGAALGQVDAQGLAASDGGLFPVLKEARLGVENTLAASFTMHVGQQLAVLRDTDGETVILDRVTTQDLHVSMNLFGDVRVGLAIPRHRPVVLRGVDQGRAYAGDFAFFVQGALFASERAHGSLTAHLDLPLGGNRVWLGDPSPALEAVFSADLQVGRLTPMINVGPRFGQPTAIPGMRWGNHWIWGLGARWEPYGPLGLTGEVFGRAPLALLGGPPGAYPAELLATVDGRIGPVILGLGGGRGLTRGLGSPALRFLGRIDVRPYAKVDRDGDGIGDFADVCPRRPEDHDGFRDQDGCPDLDNDEDGVRDVDDGCPMRPEVFNGFRDEDGCPDTHARLELVVLPEERGPATVTWTDGSVQVLGGEPVFVDVPAGVLTLRAVAEGFQELTTTAAPEDGGFESVILQLEPSPVARVRVRLTDPDGTPILGTLDGVDVPIEGLSLEHPVGPFSGLASAPGFFPQRVETELEAGDNPLGIALQPASLEAQVGFERDSDTLTDEAEAYLQSIVDYLREHPEVRLMRVEGMADDAGTSAYNHALSRRRAVRVSRWIVDRGISADRVEAVASGEAADDARRVRFRVLIWDGDRP